MPVRFADTDRPVTLYCSVWKNCTKNVFFFDSASYLFATEQVTRTIKLFYSFLEPTFYPRVTAQYTINLWAFWEACERLLRIRWVCMRWSIFKGFSWGSRDQKVDSGSVYCLEVLWLCTSTSHLTAWSRALLTTHHTQSSGPRLAALRTHRTRALKCTQAIFMNALQIYGHTETGRWFHHSFSQCLCLCRLPDAVPQSINRACHALRLVLCYQYFPGVKIHSSSLTVLSLAER